MFSQAAQAMGLRVVVLCAQASEPAAQIADDLLIGSYTDEVLLTELAAKCSAVTTEFENVPAEALAFLDQLHLTVRVSPKASSVRIAQDRVLEKAHFTASDVPVAPYCVIDSQATLDKALHGVDQLAADFFPAILKTARMGYDGKGQVTVKSAGELAAAWHGLSGVVCVLEKRMPLAAECSVLLARSSDGNIISWPVQHNVHVNGILATTAVASFMDKGFADDATLEANLILASRKIADQLAYVGVLCIEFFILADGSWVVNEMAPRPHNSGHVTMNASSMSQFEAQARAAAGLPLVQPRQHSSVVMLNLLGDVWFADAVSESPCEPDWAKVLELGSGDVGVHLNLYGKSEARRGRKMGHINITAQTLDAAWRIAHQIQALLKLPS
jgi:5-(carboxyamino)imidazole ribonucleotide synthase